MRGKRAIPVLNTAIFNSTYSGGMDVPELRLNLGGKRIGPQKIAEYTRWGVGAAKTVPNSIGATAPVRLATLTDHIRVTK